MSYEVTAKRKRPTSFDQVCGQEFVITTLKRAIERGEIANTFLFSGPHGVGKTTIARVFSRALNCSSSSEPTSTPCSNCLSCKEISSGSSLDVIEIDGASNTGVDDVRAIRDEVLFPPTASRFKVYIIDEIHMLSKNAFNALLKTIEEPPPYVKFIFATTEPHKLPLTIRSRCQRFSLRLFSDNELQERLSEAADELGYEVDKEALGWIAREAKGSLRDAYTTFDQVASYSDGKITAEVIVKNIGTLELSELNQIGNIMVQGSREKVIEIVERSLMRGVSIERFIFSMSDYLRCLMLAKSGIDSFELLGLAYENLDKNVLDKLTAEQLERASEMVFSFYRKLKVSINPRFELELLLFKLAGLQNTITEAGLLSEIQKIKSKFVVYNTDINSLKDINGNRKIPKTDHETGADHPPQAAVQLKTSIDDTGNILEQVVLALRNKKLLTLAAALQKAVTVKVDQKFLIITLDQHDAYSANVIKTGKTEVLEACFKSRSADHDLKIKVEYPVKDQSETYNKNDDIEKIRKVFRGEIVKDIAHGN